MSWVDLMTTCWDADPKKRPSFDGIVASLNEQVEQLEDDEGLVPSRANEIRAKNRQKVVAPENKVLDVDTRISADGDGSKRPIAEIV
jgi:hypothetical protein